MKIGTSSFLSLIGFVFSSDLNKVFFVLYSSSARLLLRGSSVPTRCKTVDDMQRRARERRTQPSHFRKHTLFLSDNTHTGQLEVCVFEQGSGGCGGGPDSCYS